MEIFGDVERLLSDLYPYRWPISIGLLVAFIAFIALAIRMKWYAPIVQRPLVSAAIAIPALVLVAVAGWYTLSPLWDRSYLEEASPLEAAGMPTAIASPVKSPQVESLTPAATVPTPTSIAPRQTYAGMFVGADEFHFGRGDVLLIETSPGVYTLRFENFSVRNGPDLFVYLTPDASGQSVEGAINLGGLKATDGAFNYEIPPGTDVSQFASAIVWCRQFATLFAVAELNEL